MQHVGLAVIPGDGVGPKVVDASLPVLHAAAGRAGATLDVLALDWGGEHCLRIGAAMPPDAVEQLHGLPAVRVGAIGRPGTREAVQAPAA